MMCSVGYRVYLAALFAFLLLISLEYTAGSVCQGDESKSGADIDYYNSLKRRYSNCSYVLGNVDIYPMESLESIDLPFDFLGNIREVSGYVRIRGPLPKSLKKLPFSNLRIIRGEKMVKPHDTAADQYSLLIYNVIYSESLNLNSLREISKGNVYIRHNSANCYGDKIQWNDILSDTSTQTVNVSIGSGCSVPPDRRCHSSCKSCWGPEESNCQALNKAVCAAQCEYRCFGEGSNECCHTECLAGCSGPTEKDCWGCRRFLNERTCVHQCPRSTVYNSITFRNEKNPNATVSFGKLCLKKCPDGYVEFEEGCVLHSCPKGYFANSEGKCVPCNGSCPNTCNWEEFTENNWLTSENLRNPLYQNCTVISGNVPLIAASFQEKPSSDDFQGNRAVTVEDLQIFSSVEEITGYFYFEPGSYLEGLKSLSFFKNLKRIRGSGSSGYSLVIISDHLESLDWTNFEEISSVGAYIYAPKLCYTDRLALASLIKNGRLAVESEFADSSTCSAKNQTCNTECAVSCMGPGDDQCINCSPKYPNCQRKCKNYELEGRCLPDCNHPTLFYSSPTTCGKCHQECLGGCTGPTESECKACKNFKNGIYCVEKCPLPTYADKDNFCLPCHKFCITDSYSCTGPRAILGDGGCQKCAAVLIPDDDKSEHQCLDPKFKCPNNYFGSNNYRKKIPGHADLKCRKCYSECNNCTAHSFDCDSCRNYEKKPQKNDYPDCVARCEANYYSDVKNKWCIPCNESCSGCTGPTAYDCIRCSAFKVSLNDSFVCVEKCPPDLPYQTLDSNTNDKLCLAAKPNPPSPIISKTPTNVIVGAVVGPLLLVALTAIVIAIMCRQRKRSIEETKKYEAMMIGTVELVPVSPTSAEPDLSRLNLVKESELKRNQIIGSGAFGTVYKGFLIPEGKNIKVPVAIKVLTEGSSSTRTELLDEARVMASVVHPCCIRIVAVCMSAQMMLVTPLMPNGCLLSYVRSHAHQLGSKLLLNWCAQIAKGMAHLQSCGIVHRDLAARNVLVQNENQVKITDFGLAKLLDVNEEYYKAESGKMPVKWMALESIQHRIFDHKTDVWSYGVTIWEILTFGQKPYEYVKARDIASLLERGERLSQPPICTIDIYMIMIKCWMLDSDARPTFDDLIKEFLKMARDPGRYLYIEGDQLKRIPTLKINEDEVDDVFGDNGATDEFNEKVLMSADDYLAPSVSGSSAYPVDPLYENENVFPVLNEKARINSNVEDLHSPLRYTSSPTLCQGFDQQPLAVDISPNEDYLEPIKKPSDLRSPAVDDDGYVNPPSKSTYLNVHDAKDARKQKLANAKKNYQNELQESEEGAEPLLSIENSAYMRASYVDPQKNPAANSQTYISNNNGSPVAKQAPSTYESAPDYVNQV